VGGGSPSIDPTAVNGHPAVHFNGTSDYLLVADKPSLQWGTSDFTVAVVVQHTTATPNYGALYSKQDPGTFPYYGVGFWGNSVVTGAGTGLMGEISDKTGGIFDSTMMGLNSGAPFVAILHRAALASDAGPVADAASDAAADAAVAASASLGLLVNGVDAGAASGPGYAVNVSAVGFPARIGGTPANQDIKGDIAEVIAVQGSLSDEDIQQLESYLKTKYGL
jgi:hypothetical protein